ncbi:hypothetical protein [Aliterella atlantica]|uniref:hypothetical protein n=1 Tax=Aliterella atlantica TaxID=1827278 RepID=UPI001364DAE6|nr:hypothetical protein [Aliterella atlantica]
MTIDTLLSASYMNLLLPSCQNSRSGTSKYKTSQTKILAIAIIPDAIANIHL